MNSCLLMLLKVVNKSTFSADLIALYSLFYECVPNASIMVVKDK